MAVFPIALYVTLLAVVMRNGRSGSDFETFWESGKSVLHGISPYPDLRSLPLVADRATFKPFVYPPPAAFLMVPLSLLPFAVANVLFFLLNAGCVTLALRLLDVRDWRCYGAAFLFPAVFAAAGTGAVSPVLLVCVAAAWRYRERTIRLGILIATVVALKLFLWPLGIWLLLARRQAAAFVAAATALLATLGAWWVLGFAGLSDYPHLLGRLTELVGTNSYSLYALERAAGVPSSAAQFTLMGLALALAIAASVFFSGPQHERTLFIAAIGIALLTTPILWPHYFVLLFVPIALTSRTFSAWWLVPLLLWLDPAGWSYGQPLRIIPVLLGLVVMLSIALRAGGRSSERVGLVEGLNTA